MDQDPINAAEFPDYDRVNHRWIPQAEWTEEITKAVIAKQQRDYEDFEGFEEAVEEWRGGKMNETLLKFCRAAYERCWMTACTGDGNNAIYTFTFTEEELKKLEKALLDENIDIAKR